MSRISGVHPYADKFPMLPDTELDELAESIRTNGLRNPVVVTPDGLILDGRNRAAACERAGVEPTTTVFEGDDLAEYVIDANSTRRHMSTGARAMATALVLVADGQRPNGRWKRGSLRGDNQRSLDNEGSWAEFRRRAGIVLDFAPELAERVVNGELALDAAYRTAEQNRDAERSRLEAEERLRVEEGEARAFITDTAPDLAAQVTETGPFQSYVEARAVWEKRNREEAQRIRREREAKEREQREHDQSMTDLFSGIAKSLALLASYGARANSEGGLDKFWSSFSRNYLHPPQLERYFGVETLNDARRLVDYLIERQGERK